MKKYNLLVLLLSICTLTLFTESCAVLEEDEPCPPIECNTGTFNEETCKCDCPSGYLGDNCEQIDSTKIQALLNKGITPKALYDAGVALDSLYGKNYKGGLIFYLNTTDGTGMVAAAANQGGATAWGCDGIDISGLPNVANKPNPATDVGARIGDGPTNTDAILAECTESGIAARLCRDLGPEWFLPSFGEVHLMYKNLHQNGFGNFEDTWLDDYYCTSTEKDANTFWWGDFSNWEPDTWTKPQHRAIYCRAARAF